MTWSDDAAIWVAIHLPVTNSHLPVTDSWILRIDCKILLVVYTFLYRGAGVMPVTIKTNLMHKSFS